MQCSIHFVWCIWSLSVAFLLLLLVNCSNCILLIYWIKSSLIHKVTAGTVVVRHCDVVVLSLTAKRCNCLQNIIHVSVSLPPRASQQVWILVSSTSLYFILIVHLTWRIQRKLSTGSLVSVLYNNTLMQWLRLCCIWQAGLPSLVSIISLSLSPSFRDY